MGIAPWYEWLDPRGHWLSRLHRRKRTSGAPLRSSGRQQMHVGAVQPRASSGIASRSSRGCTDFNPDLPEHLLVGEPPAVYRPAEPSLLGPANDRDERSGEAGRGKRLGGDNPDSRDRTSGAIRDDRLLTAIGDPYDSRNGQIGIACAAKKAVRSAQTVGLRPQKSQLSE